jgi:uncharacterized membrane protein
MKSFRISQIKPEIFFVLLSSLFGLAFLVITPPFQVPDEINHFYRAYQISEGHWIAEQKDQRVGGVIPKSLENITRPFIYIRWNSNEKTTGKIILEMFAVPLFPEEKCFMDFPNTGIYSPVTYLPQAFSIFISRKLGLPPLYIFYLARLFALAFWILSIFLAIKLIPFYKWVFTLLALLPMSIFINMSLSADVVTNSLTFVFIAFIFHLIYVRQKVTKKTYCLTLLLSALIASAKLVYTPVVLLFLLIPRDKFISRKVFYIQTGALLLTVFCSGLVLAKSMNTLYIPYENYNPHFRDNATLMQCANMYKQMDYIMHHGIYLWHVFARSMVQTFDMYFKGYIGTFGWLDTQLPLWLTYISYTVLLITVLADHNTNIRISLRYKSILFISAILCLALILLSLHLTWDCIGGDVIATIQGRYLIPVFPLLFIIFYNTSINYVRLVAPLILTFALFILSFSTYILYQRYYVIP